MSRKIATATSDDYFSSRTDGPRWQTGVAVPAPLTLFTCRVAQEWIDYNDHMTDSAFLWAFGEAYDAFYRYIGVDEAYRASGNSFFTAEVHMNYLGQAVKNDPLRFTLQLLDFDHKRIHFFQEMFNAESGKLLSTHEHMLIHVDLTIGRSSPIQPQIYQALSAIYSSHQSLPRPANAGRHMQIKKK
ncbi:MAG: thioesterase family protein [Candidatus Promineifilaceae bacterium]